ncbi:hypothetical protein COW99_04660 [Candidatus Roizmanbacteria bacterium CG22_combo_CG10-13_8_21_14_all_38_20]|uniref:Uncharacterized protein n=1 Tax=Candidatus Roizmanbacteria bacterium CG22_combo_CG10-13_8_21_14_all_38_20 TaxID=1974862 RepID=A0A2H0BUA6_9BACT|nr:hypothetical protein [Candidatus Microgenomates bacterium]PIP61276.1 MAG: hypothetical protein COW99_04660 [Candidatus Roizmanbacteria bacterium CG22_combo_CG10-13_8_21_14_all_38_20]PJC31070.1 MAG: hypothetical protein CO050_04385 [Candidatus Roizmanbacteria bacterium CG_4_9_14_0_2_um_filter_38_17]
MVPLTIFNLTIAFVAGFLTFFAGCLAPIAPVYIGFLAGSAPKGLDPKYKKLFTQNALIFTAGFLTVFLILGMTVNTFARSLAIYRPILEKISGILLIIFGVLIFIGQFSVISSFLLQRLGTSTGILELKQ